VGVSRTTRQRSSCTGTVCRGREHVDPDLVVIRDERRPARPDRSSLPHLAREMADPTSSASKKDAVDVIF
jgi:hypothetical protein